MLAAPQQQQRAAWQRGNGGAATTTNTTTTTTAALPLRLRRRCHRHRAAHIPAAAASSKPPITCDVAIAGAGPAGLAAAAALRRANPNLDVRLFERSNMGARGAAVLVGVNGLLALEAIDKSLVDALLAKAIALDGSGKQRRRRQRLVLDAASSAGRLDTLRGARAAATHNPKHVHETPPTHAHKHITDRYSFEGGEWLEYLPQRNDEFKERFGYHNALLGWADIVAALRGALPAGSVATGAPVTGFREVGGGGDSGGGDDGGSVQLLGADGEALCEARLAIGADGWFSGIRRQLLADGPPTFKDVVVWRARLPRRDAWLPDPRRTKWWVPRAGVSQGSQLAVLIPVPGGDLVWQCHAPVGLLAERGVPFDAAAATESGGGGASSHFEAGTGSSSVGGSGGDGASSAKERCLRVFEGFPGLAPFLDVVRATPGAQVTEHPLYQRTPESIPDGAWGRGRVTLAGDAAHAAYVDGTGMALSFEDAAVLGWHVGRLGASAPALRAFEAERIPRVKAVFSLGARNAEAMKRGVPQRELLEARAALLYGEAKFRSLADLGSATTAAAPV